MTGWKWQPRPYGLRLLKGGGQFLRRWPWAGQGGCAQAAHPPTVWRVGSTAWRTACLSAKRHLGDIGAWSARAEAEMVPLSGRTPPALRTVLPDWPLVPAPMAEALTGASHAAVQRNLAWMEAQGLIREMTGQWRYRMWRATNQRPQQPVWPSGRPLLTGAGPDQQTGSGEGALGSRKEMRATRTSFLRRNCPYTSLTSGASTRVP